MGWRGGEAYDKAERLRQREWLRSLPKSERWRVRAGQAVGICSLLMIASGLLLAKIL
jgi:hypothetical protein